MILILTKKFDYSSAVIMRWLKYYGKKAVRINIDDDGHKLAKITSTGIYFQNTRTGESINLSEATACWWRRNAISPHTFCETAVSGKLIANGIDITEFVHGPNSLLRSEAKDLTDYIYTHIYRRCPINLGRPSFNLNKLIVLDIARNAGLKVPDYTVITDSSQLKDVRSCYPMSVSKAISNGIYKEVGNRRFYTYTELLEDKLATSGIQTRFFPSLVMEKIEKRSEIRSFYLDGKFYSMLIMSQSSEQTSVDFRKYNIKKPNRTELFALPVLIEEKLTNIFNELDLNSGSVDMIVDRDGNYVFLEINPVGQYSMVSEPCNYNLDRIVANYLINGKP
jgi:ATP-GRASP peptide maturase of grasp-with-spasm system